MLQKDKQQLVAGALQGNQRAKQILFRISSSVEGSPA
jgi:hypothetical protein